MLTKPQRLLIIDDEDELREVLAALLEEQNLEIVLAANGQEATQKLRSEKFDAVLSDEKMPKKNGLEVLKWMNQEGLKIPFIIHTGYSERAMVAEAESLGVFAFISKPWDERNLIKTVKEALQASLESRGHA